MHEHTDSIDAHQEYCGAPQSDLKHRLRHHARIHHFSPSPTRAETAVRPDSRGFMDHRHFIYVQVALLNVVHCFIIHAAQRPKGYA